jgi:hypothetical protein
MAPIGVTQGPGLPMIESATLAEMPVDDIVSMTRGFLITGFFERKAGIFNFQ